jgi:hypothetical protein
MKIKVSHFLILALALSSVLMMGVTVSAKKPVYCEKTVYFLPDGTVQGEISGGIDGWFVGYGFPEEKIAGIEQHGLGGPWEIWTSEDDFISGDTEYIILSGTANFRLNLKTGFGRIKGVIDYVNPDYEQYADLEGRHWFAHGDFIIDPVLGPMFVDRFFRVN